LWPQKINFSIYFFINIITLFPVIAEKCIRPNICAIGNNRWPQRRMMGKHRSLTKENPEWTVETVNTVMRTVWTGNAEKGTKNSFGWPGYGDAV
jgi:hypothetical protein